MRQAAEHLESLAGDFHGIVEAQPTPHNTLPLPDSARHDDEEPMLL